MADQEFRHIVRIAGVDVDGNKRIDRGILKIKGVGKVYANAVIDISGLAGRKTGDLSDEQIEKITDIIRHPAKYNIPLWLLNRRKDFDTGTNIHVVEAELAYTKRDDIERMKKMNLRRGMRHAFGLKVRGQRMRSTGRKGSIMGVSRKSLAPAKKPAAAKDDKKPAKK